MRFIIPIQAFMRFPVRGFVRLRGRPIAIGILAALSLGVLALPLVQAAGKRRAKSNEATTLPAATPPELSVEVNSVGDASVKYVIHFGSDGHESAFPTTEDQDLAPDAFKAQDMDCRLDNEAHVGAVHCTIPGLARPRPNGKWELQLPKKFNAGSLNATCTVDQGEVILTADPVIAQVAQFGLFKGAVVCRIKLPEGCDGVNLLPKQNRLAFQMPPSAPAVNDKTEPRVDFQLEAQPQLISCLAKVYAYEECGVWLCRAQIKNTGSQPVTNYRVKFRLQEYSPEWTEAQTCPVLLPGQTVVDVYFPVLDLDKISKNEGIRPGLVEAQYEYTKPDGTVFTGSDSGKLEILGHNDVPATRGRGVWPQVMASFASKDDPIIRKVAGLVSSQVPGGIDESKRAGTLQYMRELYRFMVSNKFAYQIPPNDPGFQHVKFGRDVVLDRSGTCIDLAIFYESACEAVGMKTRFYLKTTADGHCFPAVLVPEETEPEFAKDAGGRLLMDADGKPFKKVIHPAEWVAVETTFIGHPQYTFEDAKVKGNKEKQDAEADPEAFSVDVSEQREKGIHSLDLPALDENALKNASIAAAPPDLVGNWNNTVNTVHFYSEFKTDGSMFTRWTDVNTNAVLFEGWGRYTYDGKLLTYSFPKGSQEGDVFWTDATHLNYRTTKSVIPAAVGAETVMERERMEPEK